MTSLIVDYKSNIFSGTFVWHTFCILPSQLTRPSLSVLRISAQVMGQPPSHSWKFVDNRNRLHSAHPREGYCKHRRMTVLITTPRLWLLELSRQLPNHAELYGFDVSSEMFPAKEWLPTNVHLNVLDINGSEFPKELEGSFDVIHARALALVVKQNDPSHLLKKLSFLLSTWPKRFPHTPLKSLAIRALSSYDHAKLMVLQCRTRRIPAVGRDRRRITSNRNARLFGSLSSWRSICALRCR